MSTETELLLQLKKQLVAFLDELITTFPEETDFVIFRIFVNDQIPIQDVMKYIVNKLCPLQSMVTSRNSNFFLQYNLLFENFTGKGLTKVNHFKNLWQKELDTDDRETMWKWFESFINIGNKYSELKAKSG